jgi:taurine dioxygenase
MTHFRLNTMPIGAEVVDIDPGSVSDPAVAAELYAAWLTHGVLIFPNVTSIEDHLALSSAFGEPELHPMLTMRDPEEPLFMPLGDDVGPAFVYDDEQVIRGRLAWHRDTAYTLGIAKGGMLRVRIVPEHDGETLFADTAAAYDALGEDVKAQIEHLEFVASFEAQFRPEVLGALWTHQRLATDEELPGNSSRTGGGSFNFPPVVHPLVTEHPESGRRCLFLSPKDAERIVGLTAAESRELLALLVDHMTGDRFVYTHKWRVDDGLVWDNRRMLHAARGYPAADHRKGQRTTLTGSFAVGRAYDPEADLAPAR